MLVGGLIFRIKSQNSQNFSILRYIKFSSVILDVLIFIAVVYLCEKHYNIYVYMSPSNVKIFLVCN